MGEERLEIGRGEERLVFEGRDWLGPWRTLEPYFLSHFLQTLPYLVLLFPKSYLLHHIENYAGVS